MGRLKFRKIYADTSLGEVSISINRPNMVAKRVGNCTTQQLSTFDELTKNENLRKIEQLENSPIN